MEDFFLKVWSKNVGAHYTQQNTVTITLRPYTLSMCKNEITCLWTRLSYIL